MVSSNLGDQIKAEVASNKVMVYSKSWCPFCTKTKDLLNGKGIAFTVKELDQESNGDAIQQTLKTMTSQNTVPNIFINGEHLGGNSDLQNAAADGSLDAKIAA